MTKGTGLYFIKSVISGVAETSVLECMNDIVAVKGFVEFCKKDDCVPEEHLLVKICTLNDEHIVDSVESYTICRGDKAEEVFKDMFNSISGE